MVQLKDIDYITDYVVCKSFNSSMVQLKEKCREKIF